MGRPFTFQRENEIVQIEIDLRLDSMFFELMNDRQRGSGMIYHKAWPTYLAVASVSWLSVTYAGEPPAKPPAPTQVPAKVDRMLYDTEDPTIIKKSRNDICHDRTSGAFKLTTSFKAYRTMKDCLDSGGRLPR